MKKLAEKEAKAAKLESIKRAADESRHKNKEKRDEIKQISTSVVEKEVSLDKL